jgi:hypothetical protein
MPAPSLACNILQQNVVEIRPVVGSESKQKTGFPEMGIPQ